MIMGSLAELAQQKAFLPAALVRALEAVMSHDLLALEPGRYEVEGDQLFFLVQDAQPRLPESCHTEAHSRYVDIQLPVSAAERYGFCLPQANLSVLEDRILSGDIAFYADPDKESFLDLVPGQYLVFFPGELHRPCLILEGEAAFRKVVVKLDRALLGI